MTSVPNSKHKDKDNYHNICTCRDNYHVKNIKKYFMISRLSQFIKNQNISVRAFEKKISASDGMIRRAISNNTDIQSKWLTVIADNYPQLNIRWLITGKGDMLLRQSPEQGDQSNSHDGYKERYLRLLEEHKELQDKYAAHLEEREKKSYATHRAGAAGVAAAGG